MREFRVHGQTIFRSTAPRAGRDAFAQACFPLVPYANRIAGGSFTFRGSTIEIPRNWALDSNPIHGDGWRVAWDVIEHRPDGATLIYTHEPREWPWSYRTKQRFMLEDCGMTVELSIENTGAKLMPAMLGIHPYFPEGHAARLAANLPRVWLTDAQNLPVSQCPTPSNWAFMPRRGIAGRVLDHCFVGWDGEAVLYWPDRKVMIRASGCPSLHVYVPRGQDYFCLEPLSDAAGALNRNADGVLTLAPGERHTIRVTFTVQAL